MPTPASIARAKKTRLEKGSTTEGKELSAVDFLEGAEEDSFADAQVIEQVRELLPARLGYKRAIRLS